MSRTAGGATALDTTANEAQAAYWNDQAGPVWAENNARLDAQLEPLGRAAMAALAPRAGDRILDIGCGAGATTAALARAVAPGGEALGVDISRTLLKVAADRGSPGARFLAADAQVDDLGEGVFDAAFSRFGVMFFADPPAAFANVRRAVKPGGRLAFVCWRPLAENLWMRGPVEAAAALLPPQAPPDPLAPGPFAFADPSRIEAILARAGWREISIVAHDEPIGAGDTRASTDLALRIGPLGGAVREAPHLADRVRAAVHAFFVAREGSDGVRLPSATWIVTANA